MGCYIIFESLGQLLPMGRVLMASGDPFQSSVMARSSVVRLGVGQRCDRLSLACHSVGRGAAMSETAIKLNNITVAYARHPAVHHVSGSFERGSMTAIAGTERRRQVDASQSHHGRDSVGRGIDRSWRPGDQRLWIFAASRRDRPAVSDDRRRYRFARNLAAERRLSRRSA